MSCPEDYTTKPQRIPNVRECFKTHSIKQIKLVHVNNVFIQTKICLIIIKFICKPIMR